MNQEDEIFNFSFFLNSKIPWQSFKLTMSSMLKSRSAFEISNVSCTENISSQSLLTEQKPLTWDCRHDTSFTVVARNAEDCFKLGCVTPIAVFPYKAGLTLASVFIYSYSRHA